MKYVDIDLLKMYICNGQYYVMALTIKNTLNSSKTLYSEKYKEHYHNLNGPEIESKHIFIDLGLKSYANSKINILEIGYGTGLNAIMTYLENLELNNTIYYHGIDILPISKKQIELLGYFSKLNIEEEIIEMFYCKWDKELKINNNFILHKENIDFNKFNPVADYDIIYFDAFSPETQPDMWGMQNLQKIIEKLKPKGIFVTYCSKGIVKQNLRNLSMIVKRFQGPIGKRHVIKAVKK
jgi:tRNA U34 5-methylaminomethyl-2-thiouridine-forming methyltransferase MnmC